MLINFKGYIGDVCEVNANDCEDVICPNGGSCIDEINGYTCLCPTGFQGPNCTELLTSTMALPFSTPLDVSGLMEPQISPAQFSTPISPTNATSSSFSTSGTISSSPLLAPDDCRSAQLGCHNGGNCRSIHELHSTSDPRLRRQKQTFEEPEGLYRCYCRTGYSGEYCEKGVS
ncbi:unnamed protein product [Protopolystoma xenopodis]|uniref:EGF-like domain-containing protein n=1 Tax=Protopolystoma xenopodis TaxID=117903 RepID=A0A3S5AQQ2_9PLAT|nr:unnamed protein product [Protopolystoma xenopodis]